MPRQPSRKRNQSVSPRSDARHRTKNQKLVNGYLKDKVLKRLTAETRFEDYNCCGFIVDYLRKCKKKWRPWDPKYCTRQPTRNTGDGVRAIHFWRKELLTRKQAYEIVTGGFGRGEAKSLSDSTPNRALVNSCVLKKNGENTSKDPSCVDKWVDELGALRAIIEKVLGDRLTEDPNNETHQMLKRIYIEELDVLPCFPAEGLEAFEDGEVLKRATGSTSSPPPALTDNRRRGAHKGSDVASQSGDEDETVDLNVLVTEIMENAGVGGDVSRGDISLVLDSKAVHMSL
ncbi:hypothetical protein Hanom_Chr12g01152201 [Helianthus anomalus]